jgi:hypothetical protein
MSIDKVTKLIISGDFNRHHPAWSHRPVHHTFAEHAEELINFFQMHELQRCLPQGTPTFWSLSDPGKASTLDLTLTNDPASSSNATSTTTTMDQTTAGCSPNGTYSQSET